MQRLSSLMLAMLLYAMCCVGKAQTVEHPLQVGGQVKPPVTIQTPDPQFPKDALSRDTAPNFALALVVNEQGLPQNIRIVRGMGDTLDRYVLECIRHYRFKPATLNGQAVAVAINIEINIDPF